MAQAAMAKERTAVLSSLNNQHDHVPKRDRLSRI
jgi:hypothetical protein